MTARVAHLRPGGSAGTQAALRLTTLAALFFVLFFGPELFSQSTVRTLMLALVLGLVAAGLNLTMGYTGQLALGHVFFYGAGAYAVGILAARGTTNLFVLLLVAIGVALAAAVITGIPGLRLSHWALAIVSFFLVELMPALVDLRPDLTGGLSGLVGIPRVTVGEPLDNETLYRATVLLLFVWLLFQRAFLYSAYGRILAVVRDDEIQLASLGVSPYRLKLMSYLLSAVPAALAGAMIATLDGLVTHEAFGFDTVVLVLAAVILGGQRTIYGPLLGAVLLVFAQQEFLDLKDYTLLGYGAFLILAALLLPRGIVGTIAERFPRWRRAYLAGPGRADDAGDRALLGPEASRDLAIEGVAKRFGGNQALADVSIRAVAGQVTALIGPNGSGKTTMLNAVSGFVRADEGSIRLGDVRLDGRSASKIATCGVGRTFQTPTVTRDLTVREAVSVATFANRRAKLIATVLRLPVWRAEERAIADRVDEVLRELGLASDGDVRAIDLPLGKKRLLEIARAVMMRPALLLLDEPAAGLSPQETDRLGALLSRLADEGTAVLLVEHNMDLVLAVADVVHVLASGRVIAVGSPSEITRDPEVLRVYLGTAGEEPEAAPAEGIAR
jgi:branched-chain amino acid transport system permease protein